MAADSSSPWIIRQRLVIDAGGACHASGYIRAVPKVALGGFLDVTRHLDPVRWPSTDRPIEPTP